MNVENTGNYLGQKSHFSTLCKIRIHLRIEIKNVLTSKTQLLIASLNLQSINILVIKNVTL